LPPASITAANATRHELDNLSHWRIFAHMLGSGADGLVVKSALASARFRAAQTALAIERCRLARGRPPDQLSDLVPTFLPAVPTDPFDGKPLRYKKLAKGYIVYSIGEDAVDNGGTEKTSNGVSYVEGPDITFTVER
jgi:hypothetical protein